jgi:hypothetical protein
VLIVAAARIEATVVIPEGPVDALHVAGGGPPDDLALADPAVADSIGSSGDDGSASDDGRGGTDGSDVGPAAGLGAVPGAGTDGGGTEGSVGDGSATVGADGPWPAIRGLTVGWFGVNVRVGPTGPVLAPLTGTVLDGAAAEGILNRSALMIKIDNHPRARPQTGLDLADIVFDLRAEGVTRFAAVFHSVVPEPVGPVRSSRTSDFDLLRGLDTPLYGSSGGNDFVTAGLRDLPIVELTNRTRNEYFRNFNRPAPHNLYINGSDLYALAGDRISIPRPWFQYLADGEALPSSARSAVGPVTVSFTGSPVVTHEWDEGRSGWLRTQDGRPHTTIDGDQLAPENVLIFTTDYSTSAADSISPEVRSTGSGELVALIDGSIIRGTWERPSPEDKPTLTDVAGDPIKLVPGRTWVLFPEAGQVDFADGQRLGPAPGETRSPGS